MGNICYFAFEFDVGFLSAFCTIAFQHANSRSRRILEILPFLSIQMEKHASTPSWLEAEIGLKLASRFSLCDNLTIVILRELIFTKTLLAPATGRPDFVVMDPSRILRTVMCCK